ncbi:hypothetical protein DTW90_33560 [Neorhizobium sp. P12A]|nr:hypothetical protein DTW90_33560 [Neorhizobium sp. P12A]
MVQPDAWPVRSVIVALLAGESMKSGIADLARSFSLCVSLCLTFFKTFQRLGGEMRVDGSIPLKS